MASGDMTLGTDDPYFDSEQLAIAMAINPKFKFRGDIERKAVEDMQHDDYLSQVKRGLADALDDNPQIPDPDVAALDSDDVSGGFAFAALAPLLPLAPGLISLAIKGITKAVNMHKAKKAKGKGIRAVNGGAVMPANYRAVGHGSVKKWIADRLPDIMAAEDQIRGLRGKKFWRNMIGLVKMHTRDAVKDLVDPTGKGKLVTKAAITKMFPQSFIKYLKSSDGKEPSSGKPEETHLRSIIRPFVEYTIRKALKGKKIDNAQLKEILNEQLGHLDTKFVSGGSKEGWKKFWTKVKAITKKVANVAIPMLSSVAANPEAVKTILRSFGVDDKWTDLIAKLADPALKAATVGLKAAQGAGSSKAHAKPKLKPIGKNGYLGYPDTEKAKSEARLIARITKKAPRGGKVSSKEKTFVFKRKGESRPIQIQML